MRKGGLRVETAVFNAARTIFGKHIFSGIHNTYHNSLINDEIWANGIGWWSAPRAYGQSDEKTFTPTQMGIAMAHEKNAMYNQYYDKDLEPVLVKAFADLRYGVRTHYHALNDKRPLRFDLEDPDAIIGINQIENCTRLLNKFNPSLPEIKLLVIFGMEALSNWYPNEQDRGVYDVNDQMKIEERAVEVWNAGYINALVPSDLIVTKQLTIGVDGKPVLNGHKFDAIVYLNPEYAREPVLKFLEAYQSKGGKLLIEGKASTDFYGNKISNRFQAIYKKATVLGYSIENIAKLGLQKNKLPKAEALQRFGLGPDRKTVLVMGGSQGAAGVNVAMMEASLSLGAGFQFIHLTGAADEEAVRAFYLRANIPAWVGAFHHAMQEAYGAADLAVARSGAASLTELAHFELPSILIPYPHAAEDHQTFNATIFSEAGAAVLLQERDANPKRLAGEIREILDEPTRWKEMREANAGLSVEDAAQRVAQVLLDAVEVGGLL